MKKNFLLNSLFVLCAAALITIAYSCKSDDVVAIVLPDANTISGTITFADTNIGASTSGYYDVAVFPTWPPAGAPTANDSLRLTKVGGKYVATYKIKGLPNDGTFALAIGWRRISGGASPVMGIYGCDTAHYTSPTSCPGNPSRITITGGAGVTGKDVLSWADTTKRVF